MRVVGIAVEATRQRPTARLAVVDDASGEPVIEATVDLPGDDVDAPTLLHDAAEALRSRLAALSVDRVVIRRADFHRSAGKSDGPKFRLLMEGALASASKSEVPDSRIGTGQETAEWAGSSKQELESEAAALVSASGKHTRFADAVAAALSGLALGP